MAPDNPPMHEALRERLRVLRMSQRALARIVGVGPQAVNKWLSGETRPAPKLWPAIDEALQWPKGHMLRLAGWSAPEGAEGSLDPAVIEQLGRVLTEVDRLKALLGQAEPESPSDP